MSAPSKLGNRGERNRSKFRAGDVGNAYKGSGAIQQKLSAGRHQHGAQTIRKVVRRMPPPVNLPSLKSESTRLGLDSGLVTPELSGCMQSGKNADLEFGQSSFFSSYEHAGLPTQKSNGNDGQTSPAGTGLYSKRTGTLADQKLRRFQEDFPQLSSVVEGTSATVKLEERLSYGPGPSLRPQNVSTWREGGGRGVLQTSPPASPSYESTPSTGSIVDNPVSPGGNLSSPVQSANTNTNTGTSRDPVKAVAQKESQTYHGVHKMTSPVDGQAPFHAAVPPMSIRPGLVPGPNGFMAFQGPVMPMMIPPFRFGHGFGHPYSAGYMYPFMPRLPLMNPLNAGLHGSDPANMLQLLGDKTLQSSSEKLDVDEAFSRLTVSGTCSDEAYSRSMKQSRDQSYDQHSSRDAPYGHHVKNYDSPEEVYGKEYKLNLKSRSVSEDSDEIVYTPINKASSRTGTGSAHSLIRSLSNVEDSDLKQSQHGVDGQLTLRSISNPCDSEEVEDDPLHNRRKQQSQLMSAAVERARKRREEEERQLKEKQMAAAREKLRQLEEKVGKKPATETKVKEIESPKSELSSQYDRDHSVSDKMASKNNTKSTVSEADEDIKTSEMESSECASVSFSGYPSNNEGYYMRHPYATLPEHLHRLPSPKTWSVTASSARMPFPQFPVDPYLYWRHLVESGGMHYYPNMRMPFNPNVPDGHLSQTGNLATQEDKKIRGNEQASPTFGGKKKLGEDFDIRSQNMHDCKLEERTEPGDCLSDSHAWNAFNSYWIQPSWMRDKNNGSKSAQIQTSAKQPIEKYLEKRSYSAVEKCERGLVSKSPSASYDARSETTKQAARYDQDGSGIDADSIEHHLYYQPWWNYNPSNNYSDPDSYCMPKDKCTADTVNKSSTRNCNTQENYSYPEGKIDRVNPPNKSTHTGDFDEVPMKSVAQKQASKGKNEDRFHYGHTRDVQIEDQPYTAFHRKTASISCDSQATSGSATSFSQKNKGDDERSQLNVYDDQHDDHSRSRSTPTYVASGPSSSVSSSAKSTDAVAGLGDNRIDPKRTKLNQADVIEKSGGISEKSNNGYKQSNARLLTDFSEDSFWGSGIKDYDGSRDRSNGFIESLTVKKNALQQPDPKALFGAENENRWNRNSYCEYQGYY